MPEEPAKRPTSRVIVPVTIGVLALAAVWVLNTYSFIAMTVDTSKASQFNVYWAAVDEAYSPDNTAAVKTYPRKKHYVLPVRATAKLERLRIDPAAGGDTKVRIRRFALFSLGDAKADLFRNQEYERLKVLRDVDSFTASGTGVALSTSGIDPQLEWIVPARSNTSQWTVWIVMLVSVAVILAFLYRVRHSLSGDLKFVPYALVVVLSLVLVMAVISKRNVHPDEYVHINAARYYAEHGFPATVCADEARYTYSVYGASRLNTNEVYYAIAGGALRVLSFLPLEPYLILRYLNAFFLLLVVIGAARHIAFRPFALPILFTPQSWYVFSYVNSEALAIVVVTAFLYQLFHPESSLRRSISSPAAPGRVATTVLAGLSVGLVLLLKQSFYFVLLYVLLTWVLLKVFAGQQIIRLNSTASLLAICLIGALTYALVELAHQWTNDFDRENRIRACAVELAKAPYNPATPLEKTRSSLYWKAKGHVFSEVIDAGWLRSAFNSGFGYYGYLYTPGSRIHYRLVAATLGILLAYVFFTALLRGGPMQRSAGTAALLTFAGLLAATLWNSWTKDFQPQGRYFFCLLPVLGSLLYLCREKLNYRAIAGLSLVLFALSVFSFVFVGINEIPK